MSQPPPAVDLLTQWQAYLSPKKRRGRPGQVAPSSQLADPSLTPVDPRDAVAQHIGGTFVLVVETAAGRYRRRCFLTAASAERAATRAREAGHSCKVYLAELRPLWRLNGSEAAS